MIWRGKELPVPNCLTITVGRVNLVGSYQTWPTVKTILYILSAALAILLYFNGKAYWRQLFPETTTYGVKFNRERSKRGVMMLPRSWKSYDSSATKQTWSTPNAVFNQDTAFRKTKTIHLQNSRIAWEEDQVEHYFKDSSFREYVTFTYYYDSLSPWQVFLTRTDNASAKIKIRKYDADSMMAAWLVQQYIE